MTLWFTFLNLGDQAASGKPFHLAWFLQTVQERLRCVVGAPGFAALEEAPYVAAKTFSEEGA
jgi:hypothetical protein